MANQQLKDLTVDDLLNKMDEISAILRERFIESREAKKNMKNDPSTSSVEVVQETVEHEGLLLRKVNSKVSAGVYVRFHNTKLRSRLKDGVIYGPVKRMMTIGDQDYNVFNEHHNRTPKTVEVFEVVRSLPQLPYLKSANQQRYETIQLARGFVDTQKNEKGYFTLRIRENTIYPCWAEFKVNADEGMVTCILRGENNGHVRKRTQSLCHPNEVFNADIGKAIALARALNINIPEEFLNAVQPDEKVIGMLVYNEKHDEVAKLVIDDVSPLGRNVAHCDSPYATESKIIDDTNAQYTDGGGDGND